MKNPEKRQSERELNREEKQIAMSLEFFPSLDASDKIFLVLIWRKLKTASPVHLDAGAPESLVRNLQATIEKAGLFFKTGQVNTEKTNEENLDKTCFVSNNPKDLDLISNLWSGDKIKDPSIYKEIGRMSGLPPTAIDVYDQFTRLPEPERTIQIKKLTLSREDKKKLFPPDLYPFSLFFYMSKAHWQTELETVRKWKEEIESVTPALYRMFVEDIKT